MASLVPFDPISAALEAVADHIRSSITGAISIRGPEEFPEDYDGSAVVFSVIALSREWTELTPTVVEQIDLTPTVARVFYKVAQLRIKAEVQLWTAYRVTGDLIGAIADGAASLPLSGLWHNRLPFKGGLELTSSLYLDRPLTITAGGGIMERDPDDVAEGMWRRIWELDILTDLVTIDPLAPVAETITLLLSTELGPDIVTEPDFAVTA